MIDRVCVCLANRSLATQLQLTIGGGLNEFNGWTANRITWETIMITDAGQRNGAVYLTTPRNVQQLSCQDDGSVVTRFDKTLREQWKAVRVPGLDATWYLVNQYSNGLLGVDTSNRLYCNAFTVTSNREQWYVLLIPSKLDADYICVGCF
jgi:hypothetical protein